MNVLPLVIAFLLIFAGTAITFLRDAKCFTIMENSLESFYRTERVVANSIAQRAYRKFHGDPIAKKEGDKTKSKPSAFCSRRSLFPPYESSKFNLAPLFEYQGEIKLHPLYEPLAEFLRLLYKKNLFSSQKENEKLEYRILDALLNKGRALGKMETFSELFPEDMKLHAIFYKMLKGTTQYSEEEGYPPLADYFTIREKAAAISVSFASPALLKAFFGSEVQEFILEHEEKKWVETGKYTYISKEELEGYLLKNPAKAPLLTSLGKNLDYSKKIPALKETGGKDSRTGIVVRAEL